MSEFSDLIARITIPEDREEALLELLQSPGCPPEILTRLLSGMLELLTKPTVGSLSTTEYVQKPALFPADSVYVFYGIQT